MRAPRRSTPHGETPYSPTSLLRALTANPYDVDTLREEDPSWAEEAPPDNRITRTITVLLALLLGFAVAVSVADLRRDAAAEDNPRALLEQEVLDSREDIDALEARQGSLEGDIAAAQETVLDGTDSESAQRLRVHEVAAAGTVLSGTGVVLSLEDSVPLPASPGVKEGTINRVTDGDLQIAVNGLWAAGAEAVSINGQRLSATSAIRTAGSAVLVDFRPLSPPYEITALGDPEALQAGVEAAESGDYLAELSTRFGIRTSWTGGAELSVPARALGTLREASPLDPTDPADGTASQDDARKDSE